MLQSLEEKLKLKYPKLSPQDAKAEMARKGWTNHALAIWWDFRENYTSRLVNNPDRPRHFDDALRNLPLCPDELRNPQNYVD